MSSIHFFLLFFEAFIDIERNYSFYNAHTEYAAHILLCCDILMSGFIFWPNGNPAAHKNILGKSIRMGHCVLHKQNGAHLYDY